MTASYRLTPRAETDLEEIWLYTAREWSPDQAESYTDEIIDVFEAIADGTKPGQPVPVRVGYRKALVGRHVIYFKRGDDTVVIVRILHQSMDLDRHI